MYHPCSALPRRELLTVALLTVSLGVGHVHAFGGVASNFLYINAHDSVDTQCLKQFQELDVRKGLHRTRGAGLRPGSAGQDDPFDLLERAVPDQRPRLVAQVQDAIDVHGTQPEQP